MRTNTRNRSGRFNNTFKGRSLKASQVKLGFAALGIGLLVGPAQATFHLMKIVELFPGTPASPSAQYVVLQMYASGQNLVGGHNITFFNAAGAQVANRVFASNLPNGANQTKILIATPQAETFFGLQADLEIAASILAAGGKACFANTIDCVAWGNYTGSATGVGTPFNQTGGGLLSGMAAKRRLNISGGATTLEAGDDTGNSATDFLFGTPAPRNNLGVLGAAPASSCGNGVIQGLEQCDDGNLTNADQCNSTCTVATYRPRIDFNGDRIADVPWRNSSTGANTIWRSANSATPQAVTAVASQAWHVVGVGDFNNDNRADLLWRNTSTGANAIWRGANSTTQQTIASVASQAWKIVGVGDFNNDGRDDILWRNNASGANQIWRSGSSTTVTMLTAITNLQWRVAGVGDFNNDKRSDILWRNTSTGANVIWRSGSSTTMQAVATLSTAWSVVGVGDFNGDGPDDILWRNVGTGANTIWRSGSSATPTVLTASAGNAWRVVAVADYNGDQRDDILWRNFTTGANRIWRSGNSATPQTVATQASQAWQVVP
jgi:cysteine-rich repeat protein